MQHSGMSVFRLFSALVRSEAIPNHRARFRSMSGTFSVDNQKLPVDHLERTLCPDVVAHYIRTADFCLPVQAVRIDHGFPVLTRLPPIGEIQSGRTLYIGLK